MSGIIVGMGQQRAPKRERGVAARLAAAERLFADFKDLTPYPYRPFARAFDTFAEYGRWKRAQTNPWYR